MAGFPGSSKTAIAREVGCRTGAAVIDKDVIMAAAIRAGVTPEDAGSLADEARAAYFIIECVVREEIANARFASRKPVYPLHPTLDDVDLAYARPGTARLCESHVTLNTTRPIDEYLLGALEYIGR